MDKGLPPSAGILTRRQLVISSAFGLVAVALEGCGGSGFMGGGTSSVSTTKISGKVAIPSGIPASSLSLQCASGTGTISGTSFSAGAQSKVPSLVMVVDTAKSKVVLLGLVDPTTSTNSLDATSVAACLLFIALGGSQMPSDGRKPLLDEIKASSALAALTATVQNRLTADPYALENADAQIIAALTNAAKTFPRRTAQYLDRPASSIPPELLIEPSGETDGVTVIQSSKPFGYAVQNARRRSGAMYTYLVGHVDQNAQATAVSPPQQVGSVLDIPRTASLFNLSKGWHPITSAPVPLSLQGADKKSIYELIYLAPVFGGSDPSIFALPRYSGELDKWKQTLSDLSGGVFVGFVADFIFEALGFGGLVYLNSELAPIIANLTTVSTSVRSLLIGAQGGGNLLPAVSELLSSVGGDLLLSPRILSSLAPLLQKASGQQAAEMAAGKLAASRYIALQGAIRVFLAVGAVALVGDLGAVYKDTTSGNRGDLFTGTVFQPTVAINPRSGFYNPGDVVVLRASVPPGSGKNLVYHWKYSGSNLAVFGDGKTVANEFDSSAAVVTLTTSPSTQGDLQFSVSVYDTTGGGRNLIGSATSTFTFQQDHLTVQYNDLPYFPDQQLYGLAMGYVEFPKSPTHRGFATMVYNLDGVDKFSYSFSFPAASAPISITDRNGLRHFIIPGTIEYLDQNDPNFRFNGEPYPYDYGDRVVLAIVSRGFTDGSSGNPTQADADASVKAQIARTKVTVKYQYLNS